jgi:hypothetical protein
MDKGQYMNHNDIYERFLNDLDAAQKATASEHWAARCEEIKRDARTLPRHEFLRWPSLSDFSVPEDWVDPLAYDRLMASRDSAEWHRVTRDTCVGMPKTFSKDYGTSPILVQHAFHLHQYQGTIGCDFQDYSVVVEVGGGYGSLCRMLRRFESPYRHFIYDLPHVNAVQRLFLSLSGFREGTHFELFNESNVSDMFAKIEQEYKKAQYRTIGMVATWSLSEMPISVRDNILWNTPHVRAYLLAYQPSFAGIDNTFYFNNLREVGFFADDVYEIDGYRGSKYLFV